MRYPLIFFVFLIFLISLRADEIEPQTNVVAKTSLSKAKKSSSTKGSSLKKSSKTTSKVNPTKPIIVPTRPQGEEYQKAIAASPACAVMDLPTDNQLLFSKTDSNEFFQPTFSGRLISAMFGCVRDPNGGGKFTRFHEGIDIRPLEHDGDGEPKDAVHAAGAGKVVYVCSDSDDSNYGKYIVIQHDFFGPPFYTLYAHLASIEDGVEAGESVQEGQKIGILGRTSNEFDIHQEFAHLHFEVNLMANDQYIDWSKDRGDGTPKHGEYNGSNLIGIDPVRFYQFLQINPDLGIGDFVSREKVAFRVVVPFKKKFSWIRHYSFSLSKPISDNTVGLEVSMTYYGLPIQIEPKSTTELDPRIALALSKGIYPLTYANGPELKANECSERYLDHKDIYWGLNSKGKAWLDQLIYN
jgi:murein DD-endopeptidase MepM/ murein hydrolase activator NlpD